MMEKPKEIIELEKYYRIELEEVATNKNLHAYKNSFQCDADRNIIGVNLSSNQIKSVSGLDKLTNLTELYLDSNQISSISGLDKLANLTELDLHFNQIRSISGLDKLTNLTNLYLYSNEISSISGLDKLTNLTELHLDSNQISSISGLDKLTNLTNLYLYSNQIRSISGLDKLTNLTNLYLSYNQIRSISGLDKLTNLTHLYLSSNQISSISGLDNLTNLTFLYLSYNQISSISGLDGLITRLRYIEIDNNPFLQSTELCLKAGDNHLDIIKGEIEKSQITSTTKIQLPQKVMLLGNHAAGKSSFLNYYFLFNGRPLIEKAKEIESTDILDVKYYQEENTAFPDAVFFDFGGQDYYHGIYRAFFTQKAINILFWNTETDKNNQQKDSNKLRTTHFNRDYWFGQLENKLELREAANSQENIFLVQTYADGKNQNKFQSSKRDCSNYIEQEFYVSLNKKQLEEDDSKYILSLQYLVKCIKEKIDERAKTEKTQNEIDLYKYVYEQKGAKSIKISKLEKIFKLSRAALRGELEQLACQGLVMYYNNDELKDVVWLEPAETVKMIHDKILNLPLKEKGKAPFDEFEAICDAEDKNLFKLLINEEIIFYDKNFAEVIIPGYLPLFSEDSDDMFWITHSYPKHSMVLKFKSFIPFGLINQLICYYGKNPDKKKYFRNFLMFTHSKLKVSVRIQLDFEHLEINISIIPQHGSNIEIAERELLDDILDMYNRKKIPEDINDKKDAVAEMDYPKEITKKRESIKAKRIRDKIPNDLYLSLDNEYFVSLSQLEKENDLNKILFYPKDKNTQTLIEEGQHGNIFQFKHITNNPKLKNTIKIFISYSKNDELYLDELIEHLRDFEPKLEIYYDKLTGLGENVHKTILDRIKDCDYIIALVSKDFLNTDYIRKIEMPEAIKNERRIIPIIVGPCRWEKIFEVYSPEKGDCISMIGNREATKVERQSKWVEIVKELEEKLK